MNLRRLLVFSLLLDIALLGAVAWLLKTRHPAPSPASAAQTADLKPQPLPAASSEVAAQTSTAESPKTMQLFDWRSVESEDYKKYIANLRSIGCPEETIRDIIIADVNKLFASRKRSLNSSTNKFVFWKTGNVFGNMINEEKIQEQQALAREKRELFKELLGVVPDEKPDLFGGLNPFDSLLDFLPSSKQTEVAELFQKYQAKMMKGLNGSPDSDDMKNMQKTQKEMETELSKILSPEELENYQLRMSQTSMMMRMQLASFDPNEQEFRDIFKLKKSLDDDFGAFGMVSQDKAEQEKYKAAKKELDAKIKSTLGDTRYQDYERAQDWAYQGIYRLAEKNNLGKEAANKVYDMKKIAEQQATKLRQDKDLSSEKRTAALKEIRAETESSIRTVFGDKAWENYRTQPGARWLSTISPDPKSE